MALGIAVGMAVEAGVALGIVVGVAVEVGIGVAVGDETRVGEGIGIAVGVGTAGGVALDGVKAAERHEGIMGGLNVAVLVGGPTH